MRLLGRSRTYKLETTDPINFPMDVNPVPSRLEQHPDDLLPPDSSSPTNVDLQRRLV
jgi:hypothetical protein